jgi:hypothetical protein
LRYSSKPRARTQTTFIVTFAPCTGIDDAYAIRSLRALLKAALRRYGLRCLEAVEMREGQS